MSRKILIVTDLDMKRLDTGIDFIFEFLQRCVQENIYVEYLVPREPCDLVKERLGQANFHYTVFKNWWGKKDIDKRHNLLVAFRVWNKLIRQDFDLVEFNFCYEITAIIAAILARLTFKRISFVWRQHSEIKIIDASSPISRLKQCVSKLKILSCFIDVISLVFKNQEKVLLARGISPKKIFVIYNGTDIRKYVLSEIKDLAIEGIHIEQNESVVINVSSLIPRKGLEYMLQAAAIVVKKFPNVKFLIVGEGPLLSKLRGLCAELNISSKVIFTGKRSDVQHLLKISDIFVLSALSEAFPLVIIEAMASGKPVVATAVAGVPEAVVDGDNGYLVQPKDCAGLSEAIITLLGNRELARTMGLRGREMVEEKFSLDRIVTEYLNLHEKLISSKRFKKQILA